ncbi:MAG: 16S rRNA (guanine(527)-N(7))-methyltransferase RsmG [Gammaproteobacteria bacterium]|nr:16S rRNA (guanine(527)-N(7))-methyltransferase RsmG [Gammaproteobacteria bacterium]
MSSSVDLAEGAAALGVVLDDGQVMRLQRFAELLVKWNASYNLISRNDHPRVLSRHLLDSLSLAPLLVMPRVLDVGTGAGLPGVPLAIARPEGEFVLMDRSEKRLRFVRHVIGELGITNAQVCEADVAAYPAKQHFDTVVSRAVAAPAALWPMIRGLLTDGGVALFQCGDPANLESPALARIDSKALCIPGLDTPHYVMRLEAVAA